MRSASPGSVADSTSASMSAAHVSRRVSRASPDSAVRSEEHTSELQSPCNLVCRLLLEKKKKKARKYDSVLRPSQAVALYSGDHEQTVSNAIKRRFAVLRVRVEVSTPSVSSVL